MNIGEFQRRLFAGAVFAMISWAHAQSFGFKNTPDLMLAYHGSAVAADLIVIFLAGRILSGQVAIDIMLINLCAILINFFGFIAYMKYWPPTFYNHAMSGIIFAHWARLIWDDDVVDYLRMHILPSGHRRSNQNDS